jgi:hypothetical protein
MLLKDDELPLSKTPKQYPTTWFVELTMATNAAATLRVALFENCRAILGRILGSVIS